MIFNVHVCVGVGHNTSLCIVPKTPTEKIFWWQGKHNYSVASFFIEGENTMFEIIRSEENSLKTSGACVCQFSERLGVKLIFFFFGLLSVHMMLNNQCSLGPFLIFLLILVFTLTLEEKTKRSSLHPNHPSLRLHITSSHRHCPPGAPQKGPFDLGARTHFLSFENDAARRKLRTASKETVHQYSDSQPNI